MRAALLCRGALLAALVLGVSSANVAFTRTLAACTDSVAHRFLPSGAVVDSSDSTKMTVTDSGQSAPSWTSAAVNSSTLVRHESPA
jgi:hypothetical protein